MDRPGRLQHKGLSVAGQYLKVPVMVRALFRTAEGPDAPRLYSGAPASPASNLREELLAASARPEILLRFVAEMDRKLDALLSYMQRESLQEDFPLHGHVTELSGAGARLESPEKLGAEGWLELLLLLEEYPMRVVSVLAAFAEARGQAPRVGRDNGVYDISFLRLEEEDREHIIRFVFGVERKRIRRDKEA